MFSQLHLGKNHLNISFPPHFMLPCSSTRVEPRGFIHFMQSDRIVTYNNKTKILFNQNDAYH